MHYVVLAELLGGGFSAGFLGSLFGIGGGVILIPLLTLVFGYGIKVAVAASLTTIVATSTMSSSIYIDKKLVNLRLVLIMAPVVIAGAIMGAHVNRLLSQRVLEILFSLVLIYTSYEMIRGKRGEERIEAKSRGEYSYYDEALEKRIYYSIKRKFLGSSLGFFTGFFSALLGIGGGVINIPILNMVMKTPLKVSMATNLMIIGLSTSTSATIYALRGLVSPLLVSTLMIGVIGGVLVGTRIMVRTRSLVLRYLFVLLMLVEAAKMLQRGLVH